MHGKKSGVRPLSSEEAVMQAKKTSREWLYADDRRNHRHRRRACSKALKTGDAAIMARVTAKKPYAIHASCAETQCASSGAS